MRACWCCALFRRAAQPVLSQAFISDLALFPERVSRLVKTAILLAEDGGQVWNILLLPFLGCNNCRTGKEKDGHVSSQLLVTFICVGVNGAPVYTPGTKTLFCSAYTLSAGGLLVPDILLRVAARLWGSGDGGLEPSVPAGSRLVFLWVSAVCQHFNLLYLAFRWFPYYARYFIVCRTTTRSVGDRAASSVLHVAAWSWRTSGLETRQPARINCTRNVLPRDTWRRCLRFCRLRRAYALPPLCARQRVLSLGVRR